MEIIYLIGDLLESPHRLILHGCNAQGVMGSGIAKQIRKKFPQAFETYCAAHEKEMLWLGDVIFVDCGSKIIANGITQQYYGRSGERFVNYEAINNVMEETHDYALKHGIEYVAMPLIGAGLGGGSWEKISSIIEDKFTDVIPVVYTLDDRIP